MGIFDFFSGGPLTQEKFAQIVLAELRKLDPASQYVYSADRFQIARPDDGFINLGNIYQEYSRSQKNERDAVLRRFLRNCVSTKNYELPAEFGDIHPDLLPVIRSRFYLESVQLQAKIRGNDALDVPQQVVGDHLALSLVYDLPSAMRTISQSDLDNWEVTFYEAVEAARQNLEQMGEIAFANLDRCVYASATGDNYDASRLVMLDLIRRFEVNGDYIAMVPNRDKLIVTGSDDEHGLGIMSKIAEASYEEPRPISTVALRLEGEEWVPWLPPRSSPSFAKFHELRLRTIGAEYNDQKELLDEVHSANRAGLYVAQFNAMQNKGSGQVTSYSVWSEGLEIMLPQTDSIFFFRPKGEKEGEIVAGGSWDHVQQVVGNLMEPAGIYPERYLVRDFPSEYQLEMIGKQIEP
jgi:hypothetical protein